MAADPITQSRSKTRSPNLDCCQKIGDAVTAAGRQDGTARTEDCLAMCRPGCVARRAAEPATDQQGRASRAGQQGRGQRQGQGQQGRSARSGSARSGSAGPRSGPGPAGQGRQGQGQQGQGQQVESAGQGHQGRGTRRSTRPGGQPGRRQGVGQGQPGQAVGTAQPQPGHRRLGSQARVRTPPWRAARKPSDPPGDRQPHPSARPTFVVKPASRCARRDRRPSMTW